MDKRQAKTYVKSQMESFLLQKGLSAQKPFKCLNPDHEDRNPSMCFDRKRNKVHCFACGADYDIFDLIGIEYGLTEHNFIFKKAYEMYGIETSLSSKSVHNATASTPLDKAVKKKKTATNGIPHYLSECRKRLSQTDYPAKRGLSMEICRRFGLGFDPAFTSPGSKPWRALIIPTGLNTFMARNTDPQAEKSQRVRKRGASPVYNSQALWESDGPLLVVEGEIDALSVIEAGAPAVALGSTANVGAFLKLVEARKPSALLLLALDSDTGGQQAEEKLAEGLENLSIPFYRISPYLGHKDANEALTADPGAFRQALEEAMQTEDQLLSAEREAYLATSAARHLDLFLNPSPGKVVEPMPTGFSGLDSVLGGGLYEGLYIMGGISSLGKTSLALQMADQLAESGRDVLIFSLEMARSELMAKSVSRLTLIRSLSLYNSAGQARTAREMVRPSGREHYSQADLKVMSEAVEHYSVFAPRIFISEGVGEIGAVRIRREVEKHLKHTGRRPVVFVDYVQIMAAPDYRGTDKQNMDKNVLELKRLSRDYQIPVIGISSFNRASYRETVTMEAFKESGAIEYSSDVLIGLQLAGAGERDFDALAAKEKNPRQVELVILKHRQGPAGRRIVYEYYPQYNYFREVS